MPLESINHNQTVIQEMVQHIKRQTVNRDSRFYNLDGSEERLTTAMTLLQLTDLDRLFKEYLSHHGFEGNLDTDLTVRFGQRNVEFTTVTAIGTYVWGLLPIHAARAWLHHCQEAMLPLIWDRELVVGRTITSMRILESVLRFMDVVVTDADVKQFANDMVQYHKVAAYVTKFCREHHPDEHFPTLRLVRSTRSEGWQFDYEQEHPKHYLSCKAYDEITQAELTRIALLVKDVGLAYLETRAPLV